MLLACCSACLKLSGVCGAAAPEPLTTNNSAAGLQSEQPWPPSSTCSVWSETAPADAWQRTPRGSARPGTETAPATSISLSCAASSSSTSRCSSGGRVTNSCLHKQLPAVSPGCAKFSLFWNVRMHTRDLLKCLVRLVKGTTQWAAMHCKVVCSLETKVHSMPFHQ